MYAQRNKSGKIVGFSRKRNALTDDTPVNIKSKAWKDYLNPPPKPDKILTPEDIKEAAFEAMEYNFGDGRIMLIPLSSRPFIKSQIRYLRYQFNNPPEGYPGTSGELINHIINWEMKDGDKYPVDMMDLDRVLDSMANQVHKIYDDYNPVSSRPANKDKPSPRP